MPEADDNLAVLVRKGKIAVSGLCVGFDRMAADLHEIEGDRVVADGAVHVHDGALVFRHKLDSRGQAGRRRGRIGVFTDDGVCPFCDDLRCQRRNVSKMIIERIAVDAAVVDDRLDGDLIERTLVEQLQK